MKNKYLEAALAFAAAEPKPHKRYGRRDYILRDARHHRELAVRPLTLAEMQSVEIARIARRLFGPPACFHSPISLFAANMM